MFVYSVFRMRIRKGTRAFLGLAAGTASTTLVSNNIVTNFCGRTHGPSRLAQGAVVPCVLSDRMMTHEHVDVWREWTPPQPRQSRESRPRGERRPVS